MKVQAVALGNQAVDLSGAERQVEIDRLNKTTFTFKAMVNLAEKC